MKSRRKKKRTTRAATEDERTPAHSQLQHECQIFIASKISLGFYPFFFFPLPPWVQITLGSTSKSLKILQIPAAPLPRYASCRVVLPLMCEITEGSGGHTYRSSLPSEKRPPPLPQIDGFWRTEMWNCSPVAQSLCLVFSASISLHPSPPRLPRHFALDIRLEAPFGLRQTAN